MKKLNNNGYMLVEIILAFVLAIGIAYFMTELVIKLKNKNDDLLVKTLVSTDQTIIYNELKKGMSSDSESVLSCDKIKIDGNTFIYDSVGDGFNDNDFINVITDYADVGELECSEENNNLYIRIPISIKQLNENYDVVIDTIAPSCELSVGSDSVITALVTENESGVVYSVWKQVDGEGDNEVETNIGTGETYKITDIGKYRYYVRDGSANEAKCGIEIEKTVSYEYCDNGASVASGCAETKGYEPPIKDYSVSGSCTCEDGINAGNPPGTCYDDGCQCPGGATVLFDYCSSTPIYDGCGESWCSYIEYGTVEIGYKCKSSDFSRIKNNNSYCWKTLE